MKNRSFETEWADKVASVRASRFWREVSSPPSSRIAAPGKRARGEVEVDASWTLTLEGEVSTDGPAAIGLDDLRAFLSKRLGLRVRRARSQTAAPRLVFELTDTRQPRSRWDASFALLVRPDGVTVRAGSETALLRASLYLSNYWSLRRCACLPVGQRRVKPAIDLQIGADLWGGFTTTQAWVHGRETDENFLELARMGVNAVPVMTVIEDFLEPDASSPFSSLTHPEARANRQRLAQLARQSARYGVHIMLMGYNPKLDPEHAVFRARPQARGAIQSGGAFRTMCTSDPATRRFLAGSWASLFDEIPELGGIVAITGGEGFYHCFMRSGNRAADCPRCSKRQGSQVVAELVNEAARAIHGPCPEAVLTTWPYSANHWSLDRDQVDYILHLDPQHVIFQTEIDKDSVDWRPAGYAKNIWDYSISKVTVSERCQHQRQLCRERELDFSLKTECSNSIDCLNVPYLPVLENQRAQWESARRLRPKAVHSRWLFDGSCKSPSEETGFWSIWGKGTEFADLDRVLSSLAARDFGPQAAPGVRRAWSLFSRAMRHHPQLDYYKGSFFIGPAQPLVLDPERATASAAGGPDGLDPAFFGVFYWQWETSASGDDTSLVEPRPLFYSRPFFRALARRGPRQGQDVALDELQELARLWERGVDELEKVEAKVPPLCRKRFRREMVLGQHLAYTWRSAAQVEEFLRLRDTIREFSGQLWVRSGHRAENLRDLARMEQIAASELEIARRDLRLIRGADYLDLRLRLDMGTASTEAMLKAKIEQVKELLATGLPEWKEMLLTW